MVMQNSSSIHIKNSNTFYITDLEESIVDMLACQWERVYEGREDVSGAELAKMEEKHLLRYTPNDQKKVEAYLKLVASAAQG